MYCKNCGNKLNDNSNFCQNCGSSINNQEQTIPAKKKGNGCLIAFIIILIISIFVIPLLIFIGGISLFTRGIFNLVQEEDCCVDAGGKWRNEQCVIDEEFDQEQYNRCTDNKYKNIFNDKETKKELKLNKYLKKYVDSFSKYEKTKEVTLTNGNQIITFKINNAKEVEKIENGISTIENINGEKAKYIIGTDQIGTGTTNYCSNMYILTEEGNIYYWAVGLDRYELVKINTDYKFENIIIVPTKIDDKYIIDANNLYNYIPIPKAFGQSYLAIGITKQDELVTINTYYPFLNIGKPTKYLVAQFRMYDENSTITKDYLKAFDTVFVYSDGSLNYTSANKLMELVNNKELYNKININENIYDESGKKIDAQFIFKQEKENSIIIVTKKNKIYEITSDLLINLRNANSQELEKITLPSYQDKNNTIENIKIIEEDEIIIKKADIILKDGTIKNLEGYGYQIYKEN